MTLVGQVWGGFAPLAAAVKTKVNRETVLTSIATVEGQVMRLVLDFTNGTGGAEPWMVLTRVGSVLEKTFWLNERGAPRAQAVQPEPTFKFFASSSANYAGMVVQALTKWSAQQHIWGVRVDGAPIVGSGQHVGANLIPVANGAAVPTSGLPANPIFVQLP